MGSNMKIVKVVLMCILIFIIILILLINLKVKKYENAFESTNYQDSIEVVFEKFGKPIFSETEKYAYMDYTSKSIQSPCIKRLWWKHPLLSGIEGWSVDFDINDKVINKYHWVSP